MFFHSLFQKDATPLLRSMTQFTGARHKLLLNDIANVDTPYYRSKKLDFHAFQDTLKGAVRRRDNIHPRHFAIGNGRQVHGPGSPTAITSSYVAKPHSFLGSVHASQTEFMGVSNTQVREGIRGDVSFRPDFEKNEGIYKYDHTSSSIEQTMSDLAKNSLMGKTFGSLLAKKYRMLDTAIRERV